MAWSPHEVNMVTNRNPKTVFLPLTSNNISNILDETILGTIEQSGPVFRSHIEFPFLLWYQHHSCWQAGWLLGIESCAVLSEPTCSGLLSCQTPCGNPLDSLLTQWKLRNQPQGDLKAVLKHCFLVIRENQSVLVSSLDRIPVDSLLTQSL